MCVFGYVSGGGGGLVAVAAVVAVHEYVYVYTSIHMCIRMCKVDMSTYRCAYTFLCLYTYLWIHMYRYIQEVSPRTHMSFI